jgi:hypothetical protein
MCPHCQQIKPIYIEAAKMLQDDPDGTYMLAEVNTMSQEKLGKHFQIRGLPTILIFSPLNDYVPTTFNKNRTTFDLITEIELASGLITRELAKYEDFAFRQSRRNENILLGVFNNDKHPLYAEMLALKEEFKYVRMYYSFNIKDFHSKLGLPNDNNDGYVLMMHNKMFLEPNDQQYTIYRQHKYNSLKEFVLRRYPYDVEVLNDKVESIYAQRHVPRAVLFTPMVNRSEKVREYALQMRALGRRFDGKLNVYLQDAEARSARKFKLAGDATYIIFDLDVEKSKYRYTEKVFNGSLDVKALIDFTDLFLAEKAPLYIRSAEVNPDDLSEPVYPVVAKTYSSVVYDTSKHVFIRFFDKMVQRFAEQFTMRKEWWKVARNYTNNTRNILIAEIEVNDNDVSDYFQKEMSTYNHYFFLYTKRQKKTPYVYKGKHNATDLIAFAESIITKEDQMKTDL